MIKDYKVTGRLMDGAIYLRFEDDCLTAVVLELNAPLESNTWHSFCNRLPLKPQWLSDYSGVFEVKELTNGRSIQDKIIMFCSAYKHYRGVPYQAKTLEKANLKGIAVTRELLDTFFKSPLANYSLDNYIKRINITRDWNKNGMNQHLINAFPDDYDAKFEASLESNRLSEYWGHLRERGWKKDERGTWRKTN